MTPDEAFRLGEIFRPVDVEERIDLADREIDDGDMVATDPVRHLADTLVLERPAQIARQACGPKRDGGMEAPGRRGARHAGGWHGIAKPRHQIARQEWGYGRDESLSAEDLIRERYRGIRPAPGYPACPDHTEKATLWRLLDVRAATSIELTESWAMVPGASVSGWYFAHPDSRYFAVGPIGRDQVQAYAARKSVAVEEVERWLRPNLAYDPDAS